MNHDIAKKIFEEIRDKPYRLTESLDDRAPNCYYKGLQLIQQLGSLGYTVRGRLGETDWQAAKLPAYIIALYPDELHVTHFYVEVLIDDKWRILDASWDSALAKAGYPVGEFLKQNEPCFKISKLYDHEEQLSYLQKWSDPALGRDYFAKAEPFLKAANAWFEKIRTS